MVPFKVTSRDIPLSESMLEAIQIHLQNLERFLHRLVHCDVVLSRPHLHHRKTRIHHVRIHLKTRLGDIVIDREPEKNIQHTNFHVAVHDAFRALERQLVTESRKLRDTKKSPHEVPEEHQQLGDLALAGY